MNYYSLIKISTLTICLIAQITNANAVQPNPESMKVKLANLEESSKGRIGIFAIDTSNNTYVQYRADERFPFCSTSKVMGVSAILKQSMKDNNLLSQKIYYTKDDLIEHSPITEKHINDGMQISDLCLATITQSDNTAINLLMKKLGGPQAVTKFARSIGDNKFRLDRWEPELNSAIPGDVRDTTTPMAMATSLQKLALGNILGKSQRNQLQEWLKSNQTGNLRIRAGTPNGWIVGDKTGTGDYGSTNDIGIIWPTKCSPIVVAIYFTQNKKDAAPRDNVIASATKIMISEFAKIDKCLR